MIKKSYYIQGMHCSACESFIEREVRELKGLNKVIVSLARSRIDIEAKTSHYMPSLHRLNRMFNKDGYLFSVHTQNHAQKLSLKSVVSILTIFVLIIILFFSIERSQFLSRFYVDSGSNALAFFLFGIAAGLSSCAALVGSLLLSVQEQWVDSSSAGKSRSFLPFALFNGSRLVTFALLGGLLGVLGGVVRLSLEVSAVLTIIVSLLLFIIGMQMLGVKFFQKISLSYSKRLVRSMTNGGVIKKNVMPIMFGAVTFFIPCGFTLIAQSQALLSGNFLKGMSILASFALGTLPVLLIISYTSVKFYKTPRFANSFRLLSGLLIVFFAIFTINAQFKILHVPAPRIVNQPVAVLSTPINENGSITAPTSEISAIEPTSGSPAANPADQEETQPAQPQLMQMEARGFEYFPDVITIEANLLTRFEITDNGSIGCARAVYARGLYPDVILLNPGMNVVEFVAPSAGTYQVSCSMWMVRPIMVIVE